MANQNIKLNQMIVCGIKFTLYSLTQQRYRYGLFVGASDVGKVAKDRCKKEVSSYRNAILMSS